MVLFPFCLQFSLLNFFSFFFFFFVIVDFCFIFYKTLALKDSNTIQTAPPVPTPGVPAELGVPLAFFFFFFFLLWLFSFVPSLASGAGGQVEGCAGAGGICIAVTQRRWSQERLPKQHNN